MTTPHTKLVLDLLYRRKEPITTAELVAAIPAERPAALLTLGICVRCGQIKRTGWNDAGLSLWSLGEQTL